MRPITANPTKAIFQKSKVICTDNSGAKIVHIISALKTKTVKGMKPGGGIATTFNVVIKKGKPEMRKKIEKAVLVRSKKEYMRKTGMRIKFEDNAVALIDDKGLPKASEIKGAIAKEVAERFPKVAGIASSIV